MRTLSEYELFFLQESNRIEGITRPVNEQEKAAFVEFYDLPHLSVEAVTKFVKACQPNAVLRDRVGLNVQVGSHLPPLGGSHIVRQFENLISRINDDDVSAYTAHIEYETLHPYTDGNGRSGRMIWWWMMGGSRIGFLHRFYYQALDNSNLRKI